MLHAETDCKCKKTHTHTKKMFHESWKSHKCVCWSFQIFKSAHIRRVWIVFTHQCKLVVGKFVAIFVCTRASRYIHLQCFEKKKSQAAFWALGKLLFNKINQIRQRVSMLGNYGRSRSILHLHASICLCSNLWKTQEQLMALDTRCSIIQIIQGDCDVGTSDNISTVEVVKSTSPHHDINGSTTV